MGHLLSNVRPLNAHPRAVLGHAQVKRLHKNPRGVQTPGLVSYDTPAKMLCFRESETKIKKNAAPNNQPLGPRDRHTVLAKLDAEVTRDLAAAHKQDIKRGLFLGTGESGKSTVFKQMRINHGSSFSAFECFQYAKLIWADTLRTMRGLIHLSEIRNLKVPSHLFEDYQTVLALDITRETFLRSEKDPNARRFLEQHTQSPTEPRAMNVSLSDTEEGTEDDMRPRCEDSKYLEASREQIARAVHALWTQWPELQRVAMPAILETNGPYFFQRILSFADPNYQATPIDIVNARLKTTGIIETVFDIRGSKLAVVDVGGQRVERTKWVHCFDDVTCVFFVVAVSEFDQTLKEDTRVNRLIESLEVFDQCVNSKWLRDKPITLFLNKMDILESKLAYCSFSEYYPGFTGDETNPYAVVDYIEGLFKRRVKSTGSAPRGVYTHRTCATDIKSMKFVIEAVTDMIFVQNMQWAGMV